MDILVTQQSPKEACVEPPHRLLIGQKPLPQQYVPVHKTIARQCSPLIQFPVNMSYWDEDSQCNLIEKSWQGLLLKRCKCENIGYRERFPSCLIKKAFCKSLLHAKPTLRNWNWHHCHCFKKAVHSWAKLRRTNTDFHKVVALIHSDSGNFRVNFRVQPVWHGGHLQFIRRNCDKYWEVREIQFTMSSIMGQVLYILLLDNLKATQRNSCQLQVS